MPRNLTEADQQTMREFAIEAARLLDDRHCDDVTLLDVRDVSHVCNYVLLASGTSDRQMKSLADELQDLGDEYENPCFRSNKDTAATWIVVDFIDLVAHLFEPTQRAYYDLETLWSDGERVAWQREAPAPTDAGDESPRDRR